MRYLSLANLALRLCVAFTTLLSIQPTPGAESAFNLDAKIAETVPTKDEDRWLTIPWRTNLMKARLEAQNANRPMFLWIMNGNPMGCT